MGVKVSALDAAPAIAAGDLLALIDVSDTSAAHPAGKSVKGTVGDLATAVTTLAALATDAELAAVAAAAAVASNLTSGTVPTARLGSGTPNSTKFLRGDQTWAAPTDVSTVGGSLYLFANYY